MNNLHNISIAYRIPIFGLLFSSFIFVLASPKPHLISYSKKGTSCSTKIYKSSSKKSYSKKAPYEGFGQRCKSNDLPRTKAISGHGKRTKNGYTYVNPYAKSK